MLPIESPTSEQSFIEQIPWDPTGETLSRDELIHKSEPGDLIFVQMPQDPTRTALLVTAKWNDPDGGAYLSVAGLTPTTIPPEFGPLRAHLSLRRYDRQTGKPDDRHVTTAAIRIVQDNEPSFVIPARFGSRPAANFREKPLLGRDRDGASVITIRPQRDFLPASSSDLMDADERRFLLDKDEMEQEWWYEAVREMKKASEGLKVISPEAVAWVVFNRQWPAGITRADINYQGKEGRKNAKELQFLAEWYKLKSPGEILEALRAWRAVDEETKQNGYPSNGKDYLHEYIFWSVIGPQLLKSYEERLAAIPTNNSPRDTVIPIPPETTFTRYRLDPRAQQVELPNLEDSERQRILDRLQKETDVAIAEAGRKSTITAVTRNVVLFASAVIAGSAFLYDDIRLLCLGGAAFMGGVLLWGLSVGDSDSTQLAAEGQNREQRMLNQWQVEDGQTVLRNMQVFIASKTNTLPDRVDLSIFKGGKS